MTINSVDLSAISRRSFMAGMAAVGGAQLLSIGPSFAQGEPNKGGKFRACVFAPPNNLDPLFGNFGFDQVYLWPMLETLVDFEPETYGLKPGLASWDLGDGGKTITFTLVSGAKFHDGTPLNAEAVKFNLDRARSHEKSLVKADLNSIESVEVTGENTVVVGLATPTSQLVLASLTDRAGMMQSPAAIEARGDAPAETVVGTGPYKLEQYLVGERMTMVRYDDYVGNATSYPDSLELVVIPDPLVAMRTVAAGENNFAFRLSPVQKETAEKSDNVVWVSAPAQTLITFYVNTARERVADPRVRQAISLAINRPALNQVTSRGLRELPTSPILPEGHWAHSGGGAQFYTFDPDRAKSLLAEAGVAGGVTLNVVFPNDPQTTQIAEFIAANLAEVGIKLQLTPAPAPQANAQFTGDKAFDLQLASWSGRADPIITIQALFGAKGIFNPSGVAFEGLEALIAASEVEDVVVRREALRAAQDAAAAHASIIPILFDGQHVVHSKSLGGWVPNIAGKPKFDGIWLES